MKIKRNTITTLILGCVLSANITIATANTVDQSELSGTWTTDVASGDDATAFSKDNLSALTTYDADTDTSSIDYTLGSYSISERDIDYTFNYITEDGVTTTYIENPDGSQDEFWGFKESVTVERDEDTRETTYTITSTGEEISETEYNTYYFDEKENYITILGGVVDLDLTATATDANAVAFSITDVDGNKDTLSDEYIAESSEIDNYTEDQIETLVGYMTINATATATGGDATAIYGNIEHSYLTVTGTNGTIYFKEVNGDLTLNLSAKATASYNQDNDDDSDDTTEAWSSAKAVGIDGNIDSSVGNSYIDITALSYGGTATGIDGTINVASGNVDISAVTYDRTVNRTDGVTATLDGGDATAITGETTFAGTSATLKAVSSSGAAVGVANNIEITNDGNISIITSGGTSANGVTGTTTLTDSTLSVSSTSSEDATGLSTLTATDSTATISVNGTDSATGVTTATLKGETSLTVYATSTTEAIGVETLNAHVPSETTDSDDISVKITATSSTKATGVETFGTISSTNASFDISAIASNTTDTAVSATAIENGITLSSNVESFNGTIAASASSTKGTATATAIDGAVDGDVAATITASASSTDSNATATAIDGNVDGNITGTIIASASSEKATAEAIAINGDVTGDITGTVTATATGSTATAIQGTVGGDVTGTLKATSTSTIDNDDAEATVISGTVDGTISGTLIAVASATGAAANATATAIEVTADSTLTFDNTTIVTIATATDGTATNNAIDASGVNLTIEGDVALSGNITAGSLTLSDSSITQKGGTLDVGTLDITSADSNYSMSFDVNGNLPEFNNTTINYSYVDITDVDSITSAASGILTATASALVGDNSTFADGAILVAGTSVSTLLTTEGLTEYDVEGSNGLDYNVSLDSSNDTVITVTKTTYFEDKATTGNAATLGAALDAIEASETDTDWNFDARTMKEAVDLLDLDSFVPYANSFMSQVNAQTYANLGLATVWRMRALMDKGERTKREIAAEAIRNNPAFDGVEPDPEFGFKTRRVAQFQSVNVVASLDGGENAPDYDFISTGGTADIDFALYNNLLLGVGVGGIYNKIDGSNNSGDAESTSFVLNMYAMYSVGDFDIFATVGYAHGFNESEKSTDQGKSEAKWDSDSIFHLAGVSYKIDFDNGLILRPMAMYSLVYQNNGESTSKNATDYSTTVSSESYLNLKSYIGGELIYSFTKKFDLVARAFWTHEFGDNSYDFTYTNSFTSQYIGSIAYSGDEADKDTFLLGLSLGYKFTSDISAYLDYNANISGDYLGHNLNAALQVRF